MSKRDEGVFAFGSDERWQYGISMLDYIAIQAMTGLLSGNRRDTDGISAKDCAKIAYDIAWAMVEEGEKEESR